MTNEDRTDTPLLFKGEDLSAGELRAEIAEEARRRIDQCEESVTAARAKGDRAGVARACHNFGMFYLIVEKSPCLTRN
mgnify:CR=1 FL=1